MFTLEIKYPDKSKLKHKGFIPFEAKSVIMGKLREQEVEIAVHIIFTGRKQREINPFLLEFRLIFQFYTILDPLPREWSHLEVRQVFTDQLTQSRLSLTSKVRG